MIPGPTLKKFMPKGINKKISWSRYKWITMKLFILICCRCLHQAKWQDTTDGNLFRWILITASKKQRRRNYINLHLFELPSKDINDSIILSKIVETCFQKLHILIIFAGSYIYLWAKVFVWWVLKEASQTSTHTLSYLPNGRGVTVIFKSSFKHLINI